MEARRARLEGLACCQFWRLIALFPIRRVRGANRSGSLHGSPGNPSRLGGARRRPFGSQIPGGCRSLEGRIGRVRGAALVGAGRVCARSLSAPVGIGRPATQRSFPNIGPGFCSRSSGCFRCASSRAPRSQTPGGPRAGSRCGALASRRWRAPSAQIDRRPSTAESTLARIRQ